MASAKVEPSLCCQRGCMDSGPRHGGQLFPEPCAWVEALGGVQCPVLLGTAADIQTTSEDGRGGREAALLHGRERLPQPCGWIEPLPRSTHLHMVAPADHEEPGQGILQGESIASKLFCQGPAGCLQRLEPLVASATGLSARLGELAPPARPAALPRSCRAPAAAPPRSGACARRRRRSRDVAGAGRRGTPAAPPAPRAAATAPASALEIQSGSSGLLVKPCSGGTCGRRMLF